MNLHSFRQTSRLTNGGDRVIKTFHQQHICQLAMRKFPESHSFTALIFTLIAVCWMVSSLPASAAQQILKSHVPPITKRLTPVSRLDGGTRLDLAIGLPLRNHEQLTNLLEQLYQPGNANFHQPGRLPEGD
jgi:hypothetical protein